MVYRGVKWLAAGWLVCSFQTGGLAQEKPAYLETTVVSPRKVAEPYAKSTRAITILPSESLEEEGVVRVGDALRDVAGMYVRGTGSLGGSLSAIVRGSSAAHVLTLIDGIPLNSPTLGNFDFSHLTVDNVDRIEVLRGSASVLYGSEAVGGVVNILTKHGAGPEGLRASGMSEFGSNRTFRERADVQGTFGPQSFSVSASRLDSEGSHVHHEYHNTTFSMGSEIQLSDVIGMGSTVRYHHTNVGIDDGAFQPDPNRTNTEDFVLLGADARHRLAEWWQHRLAVSMNRSDSTDLDQVNEGSVEVTREDRFVTTTYDAEWQHDLFVTDALGTVTGFELKSQSGDTGGFSKSALTGAWYVQPHLTLFDRLTLVGGTRLFRHNAFGRGLVWESSASCLLTEHGPKLRGGYSEGFRTPTLNDLYFPDFGNPELRPETSRTYELGVDHEWWDGRATGSISVFRRNVRNLIQFAFLDGRFAPFNVGKSQQQGVELETSLELGHGVRAIGQYGYVNAFAEPSKEELIRVPHQTASVSLRYAPSQRAALLATYRFAGSSEEFDRNRIKRRSLIDLGATFRLTPHLELYVRTENVLGTRYQEIIGFPSDGARFFGGVRLTAW